MDLLDLISPAASAIAAWVATIAVIKTDIEWLKRGLDDNEKAASATARRLDRHMDNHH